MPIFSNRRRRKNFVPKIVHQVLIVRLLPRFAGEEPETLEVAVEAKTWNSGLGLMKADDMIGVRTDKFLEKTGSSGVRIDSVFYPHSRIDKVTLGDLITVQEGE